MISGKALLPEGVTTVTAWVTLGLKTAGGVAGGCGRESGGEGALECSPTLPPRPSVTCNETCSVHTFRISKMHGTRLPTLSPLSGANSESPENQLSRALCPPSGGRALGRTAEMQKGGEQRSDVVGAYTWRGHSCFSSPCSSVGHGSCMF